MKLNFLDYVCGIVDVFADLGDPTISLLYSKRNTLVGLYRILYDLSDLILEM